MRGGATAGLLPSISRGLLLTVSALLGLQVQAGNEVLCNKFSDEATAEDKLWYCWYQDPCAGASYTYPSAFNHSTPCTTNEQSGCEALPAGLESCNQWVDIPDSASDESCPSFDCCDSNYGVFYEDTFCEGLQCEDVGPSNIICVEDSCTQGEVMTENGCQPAPPQVPWPPPQPPSPPPIPPDPPLPPPLSPAHPPPLPPPSLPPSTPFVPLQPPSPFPFRPAHPAGPPSPLAKSPPPPNNPFSPLPPFSPRPPPPSPLPAPPPLVSPPPVILPPTMLSPPPPAQITNGKSPPPPSPATAPLPSPKAPEPPQDAAKLGEPPPAPPSGDTQEGGNDSAPWWIWLIVGIVAAVLTFALGVFLWRSRRQRLQQRQEREMRRHQQLKSWGVAGADGGSHSSDSYLGMGDGGNNRKLLCQNSLYLHHPECTFPGHSPSQKLTPSPQKRASGYLSRTSRKYHRQQIDQLLSKQHSSKHPPSAHLALHMNTGRTPGSSSTITSATTNPLYERPTTPVEARGSNMYNSLERPRGGRAPPQQAFPRMSRWDSYHPTQRSSAKWEHQGWGFEEQRPEEPRSWVRGATSPAFDSTNGRGDRSQRALPGSEGAAFHPQAVDAAGEHGRSTAVRGGIQGYEAGSGIYSGSHGGSNSDWQHQRQSEWLEQQERLSAHHRRTQGFL